MISLNNIKQLNSLSIYDEILSSISSLLIKSSSFGITNDQFYNIVIGEIKKSKDDYDGSKTYIDYIKSKINIRIKLFVSELIKEDPVKTIENFIKNNFSETYDYNNCVDYFNKLVIYYLVVAYIQFIIIYMKIL